jgi:putrescine transport system ATP-binding protein
MMDQEFLQIENISKRFGDQRVLNEVSFTVAKHQVLSILGKSGSGKTTLLKIIAGLEQEDGGGILLSRKRINHQPPQQRNIVYLYQEPLLFPHLNVRKNISFGLELRKESTKQIDNKVNEILDQIGLKDQGAKMPHQLSGGQRQRVSFARALIIEPQVLLLDEPFGALDTETRYQMQELFKKVSQEKKLTSIFITHDLKEAMIMGDHIGKIENGNYRSYNSKTDFYNDPESGAQAEAAFWKKYTDLQ